MRKVFSNKKKCTLFDSKDEPNNKTISSIKIIEKKCSVCGYSLKKEIKNMIADKPIMTRYHGMLSYDLNKFEEETILEGDLEFISKEKGIVICPKCGVMMNEKIITSIIKKD